MYDERVAENDLTLVQLVKGSNAGAVPCRLNDQQRAGQACLVCGRQDDMQERCARVGYVDGRPVFIHTYCSGRWQNGDVRVR
jgi:hypothetical protein